MLYCHLVTVNLRWVGVGLDSQEMLKTGPTIPSKESDNLCDNTLKDDADELMRAVDHGKD